MDTRIQTSWEHPGQILSSAPTSSATPALLHEHRIPPGTQGTLIGREYQSRFTHKLVVVRHRRRSSSDHGPEALRLRLRVALLKHCRKVWL